MSAPELRDRDARVRAATVFDRNLVVVAGAGTGKTSLLVERFLNLLLSGHVELKNILAITFTEKATGEMRERVAEALEAVVAATAPPEGSATDTGRAPDESSEAGRSLAWLLGPRQIPRAELHRLALDILDRIDTAAINTIHGTCSDLLRRNALDAGLPITWSVDEGTTQEILFDDLWPEFLAGELGVRAERGDLWHEVLAEFSEREIEEAARSLALAPVACDQLAREGYVPVDAREAFGDRARELCRELEGMREELVGRSAMPAYMDSLIHLLGVFQKDGVRGVREVPLGDLPLPEFWEKTTVPSPGPPAQLGARRAVILDAAKRARKLLEGLLSTNEDAVATLMEVLRPFARDFRRRVLRDGLLIYDDLLLLARNLLRDCPEVRVQEAERARAILVDEFQDTDPLQYEILFYLTAAEPEAEIEDPFAVPLETGRLFIVGDPKQSIYRFRGADMAAFMEARDRVLHGGAEESLATNFRSRPGVLEPLNRLFAEWMGPVTDADRDVEPVYEPIHARRDAGDDPPNVELWTVGTRRGHKVEARRAAEGRAIARFIHRWLEDGASGKGTPQDGAPREGTPRDGASGESARQLKDIAILFRALGDLPLYVRELRRAGIDFVVDGGKAFVERPEVVEAMALLEALANPADAVSTLAVVRSPMGGATDARLAAYVREGGRFYWPADRDPALAQAFPEIDGALSWLRDLDRATVRLPIDRRIQVALTESGFLLPQAAFFEGPQRAANIRKLAERAARLARDRGLTLEETIGHLRGEFTGSRGEGESPLADEAVNAVRILTIHKAKGLEFPLVIVPDLGRRPKSGEAKTRILAHRHRGGRYLAALVKGRSRVENLASLLAEEEKARHDRAENKRVLYVATTRAKNRLVLVNSAIKSTVPWLNALAKHWDYTPVETEETSKFVELGELAGGEVIHRGLLADEAVVGEPEAETLPVAELARAFREAAAAAERARLPLSRTPSADRRAESVEAVPDADPEPGARRRELARAVGSAVHQALEHADFNRPSSIAQALREAAPGQARAAGIAPEDVLREAEKILAGFVGSDLPAYLAGVEILARETAILFRDPDGSIVHGYVDLVYRRDGRVHVADYKTDAGSGKDLADHYRPQLQDYAAAVTGALGLSEPPVLELLLVRSGERVRI